MTKLIGLDFSENLFAKRLSLGFLVNLLAKAKGLITLPFYTRLLGADGLGIFSLILVTSNILLPLMNGNLTTGLGVYTAALTDKEEIKRNYYSALYSSLFIAFLSAAILLLIGSKILPENVSKYLWIVVLFAFTNVSRNCTTIFPQMFQKTKVFALSVFLMDYIGAAISITLVYLGYGAVGAVAGIGLANAMGAMVLFYIIYKNIGISLSIDLPTVKKFAFYSLPLIPMSFSGWIMDAADKYLIYHFCDTAEVGIYSVAYSISSLIMMVSAALYFTFGFSILKLWDEDREYFYNFIRIVTKWTVISLTLLLASLFIGTHILVSILAGPGFSAAESVIPILGLGLCAATMNAIFSSMFGAIKNSKIIMIVLLSAAVLNLVLNILLIPIFGITGAAVATAISYIFSTLFFVCMVRRYFELYLNYVLYIKLGAAGVAVAVLILFVKKMLLVNIFTAALLATIIAIMYVGLLLMLRCVTVDEIKQIINVLKQ